MSCKIYLNVWFCLECKRVKSVLKSRPNLSFYFFFLCFSMAKLWGISMTVCFLVSLFWVWALENTNGNIVTNSSCISKVKSLCEICLVPSWFILVYHRMLVVDEGDGYLAVDPLQSFQFQVLYQISLRCDYCLRDFLMSFCVIRLEFRQQNYKK